MVHPLPTATAIGSVTPAGSLRAELAQRRRGVPELAGPPGEPGLARRVASPVP
ncbi:MAG TPA: hypothetical protein VLX31_04530 [Streptosporangiaceae bacterium]|nr:hypothetical protein [Streptosporangiaceae bacterium]